MSFTFASWKSSRLCVDSYLIPSFFSRREQHQLSFDRYSQRGNILNLIWIRITQKSVRLRDTFAGKMRLRILGPHPSCEKVVLILPAKVSRKCPYQVIILGTGLEVKIRTHVRLKIITWYKHLCDTFAGKNFALFQNQFPDSKFLYRGGERKYLLWGARESSIICCWVQFQALCTCPWYPFVRYSWMHLGYQDLWQCPCSYIKNKGWPT